MEQPLPSIWQRWAKWLEHTALREMPGLPDSPRIERAAQLKILKLAPEI
jgi:hypothetical protein